MNKKRKYLETHPWLNFSISLEKVDPQFWMLLGEIQSKCEHIAGTPLLPSVAEEFYKVYLAKGVFATTAIEGNTLSEEEVLQHLEGKLKLPPSKEYLKQEIDNVIKACNLVSEDVFKTQNLKLDVEEIKEFNRIILKDLELEDGVVPGKFREHKAIVGRYRGTPPEDCEYLTQRLVDWLNGDDFSPPEGMEIAIGVLKAIIAHVYFVWIHPFGDGNGRTARLIELKVLLSAGVPNAAAHLLSNFYNQTRMKYYLRLDQASKKKDGIVDFIKYALEGFRDELKGQLIKIRTYQWNAIWTNYVHSKFKNKNGPADIRRRHLALDLTDKGEVPIKEVRYISPRLAQEYGRKSQKAVSRDINKLIEYGLIVKSGNTVRAKKEVILGFLPASTAIKAILFGES